MQWAWVWHFTIHSSCAMIMLLPCDPVFRHMEDEPMEAPEARIALIQAEAEGLAQYLTTLPPDAWCQPSACQEWEVRDVVAHLVEGAQFYVHTITRGVQGDMARPPERVPSAFPA